MVRYIGAKVTDVTRALREHTFRIVPDGSGCDVRGGGAVKLSTWLKARLVKRWWNAGAGTKITVGWVHSDGIWTNGNQVAGLPRPSDYRLVTAVLTRPRSSRGIADHVFDALLESEIYKKDDRLRYVNHNANGLYPLFTGNNTIKYGISSIYAWPAGIIDDPRINNGLSKVHEGYRLHAQRRANIAHQHHLTRLLINSSGTRRTPEAITWAKDTIAHGVRRRKLKIQQQLGRQTLAKILQRSDLPVGIRRKINAYARRN